MWHKIKIYVLIGLIITFAFVAYLQYAPRFIPQDKTTQDWIPNTYNSKIHRSGNYFVFKDNEIKLFDKRNIEIAKIENNEKSYVYDATWSPDGMNLAYLVQETEGIYLNIINISTRAIQRFPIENNPRYGGFLYLQAWSESKNIIVVQDSPGGGGVFEYIDLNASVKKFIEIPLLHSFRNIVSDDGNYIFSPTDEIFGLCTSNEMAGDAPSKYEYLDIITLNKVGEFGDKNSRTEIIGFTDKHEVIYATFPPEYDCYSYRQRSFFKKDLQTNSAPFPITEHEAYVALNPKDREYFFILDDRIKLDDVSVSKDLIMPVEGVELPTNGPMRYKWEYYYNEQYGLSFLYPPEKIEIIEKFSENENIIMGFGPIPNETIAIAKEKNTEKILFAIYPTAKRSQYSFVFDKEKQTYVYSYFGGLINKRDVDCTSPFMGHKEIPSAATSWGEGYDYYINYAILNAAGEGISIEFDNTMQGPEQDIENLYKRSYIDALRIYILESLKFDQLASQPIKFMCKFSEYDR